MSRDRNDCPKFDTQRLVEEAERLARTANERTERLRINMLEMRVHELKRQLIMSRMRTLIERGNATPLVAASPAEPVAVTIVRAKRATDEWPPIPPTVH